MAKFSALEAANALMITYNHQINNILTVAMTATAKASWDDPKFKKKCNNAHMKIAEIVHKIREAVENSDLEYEKYSDRSKMLKIDK